LDARHDLASSGLADDLTVLSRPVLEGHQIRSNVSVGFQQAAEDPACRRMVPYRDALPMGRDKCAEGPIEHSAPQVGSGEASFHSEIRGHLKGRTSALPEDVWPEFKARAIASYQALSRANARELAAYLPQRRFRDRPSQRRRLL
jgi:hypothetical protein